MKIFRNLASVDIGEEDSCLILGVFDGVHIGHQRLLRRVAEVSRARGLLSMALTFDPHPEAVLSPKGGPPLITNLDEKLALFRELGLKAAVVLSFDRALANMPARDFVKKVLLSKLRADYIVAGPESTFGKGAKGNAALLQEMGEELGFHVEVIDEVVSNDQIVSSTAIRQAIQAGEMEQAAKMLGRPYRISGTVVTGAGRGQELGFPTANLSPPAEKVLPPDGVYACVAGVGEDIPQCNWDVLNDPEGHVAVVYIGKRPTFGGGERLIEVHLCEEDLQLYGKELGVCFFSRLRGDITFASPEELVQQMVEDARQAFEVVGEYYSQ